MKSNKSRLTKSRLCAFEIWCIADRENKYVRDVLNSLIENYGLLDTDKAFATKLVMTLASTYGILDDIINATIDKPDALDCDVRNVLRLAACEIIYLNKPDYAVVDQGVELVKTFNKNASGLVNFCLRHLRKQYQLMLDGSKENIVEYLALKYAFPKWLSGYLIDLYGAKDAESFMKVSNEQAPLFFCINNLKHTDDEANRLKLELNACAHSYHNACGVYNNDCFIAREPYGKFFRKYFKEVTNDNFIISDFSAQEICKFAIGNRIVNSLLEIGCGSGTKTSLLLSNISKLRSCIPSVHCIDYSVNKIRAHKERFSYLSDDGIIRDVCDVSKNLDCIDDQAFDLIFIDAPCSGLGTIRRHPELKWRLSSKYVDKASEIDYKILVNASSKVAKGGSIVYSTCTVLPKENEEVITKFLNSKHGNGFSIERYSTNSKFYNPKLLSKGPDAHFAAKLRYKGL